MTAHWRVEDAAAFVSPEAKAEAFFRRIHGYLKSRIKTFVWLPLASLDRLSLQHRLDEIGRAMLDERPAVDEAQA
jgi:hypothetical protein